MTIVIPVHAGIQAFWIPASAGMTGDVRGNDGLAGQPRQLEPLAVPPQHTPLLIPIPEHDALGLAAIDMQLVHRRPMRMAVNDAVDAITLERAADLPRPGWRVPLRRRC